MKLFHLSILSFLFICISCKSDKSQIVSDDKSNIIVTDTPQSTFQNNSSDTLVVNTMQDLVANAQSNRVLVLRNIDYALEKNLVYYISKDEKRIIDKKVEETRSLGGQLYISGLDNFQIIGQEETEMISDNEMAIPLYIVKSSNIQVANIKFRHSDRIKAPLKVSLSYISGCRNMKLSNCKFEGKGTYGVHLNNVNNFAFVGGEISKCTKGILNILNSKFVSFESCKMKNNRCANSAINIMGTQCSVIFQNVDMAYNISLKDKDPKSTFFSAGRNSVTLKNCVLKGNKNFSRIGLSLEQLSKTELSGMEI